MFFRDKNTIRDARPAFALNVGLRSDRRRGGGEGSRTQAGANAGYGFDSSGAMKRLERSAKDDRAPVRDISDSLDLDAYVRMHPHVLDLCP